MNAAPVTRVLAAGALWLAAPGARAAPEPGSPVQPTVTAAMGDVGGKFFGRTPDPHKVRHTFIAAEPELWNYTPTGRDEVSGRALPRARRAEQPYAKLRYVQYTDATFTTKVLPNPSLGILGPDDAVWSAIRSSRRRNAVRESAPVSPSWSAS